jgi:hypothetical protein
MKNVKYLFTLIALSIVFAQHADAQCLDFAKAKGFAALDTVKYVPEGRVNAIPLSEGDMFDVYKPFFRGRQYKIVVVGADNMPKLNFKVTNFQQQVLYDSTTAGGTSYEFTSETNQNLIISVEVPASETNAPKTGCIAVIVGFIE